MSIIEITAPPVVVVAQAGTTGARGPKGDTGAKGDKGDKGDAGTGGSGRGIKARARVDISSDAFVDLPVATSWTVVHTSAGDPLQCSVLADVGDIIEFDPNFAYQSSIHYFDFALLDAAGAPSVYAASGTSSPLAEGNILEYPSTSVSRVTSTDEFTVGPEHIGPGGTVTIALTYIGSGAGKAFAYPLYHFKLRLTNIGADPG